MRHVYKALRVVGWIGFGAIVFVVALAASTYAYLRSARGRDQVVVFGLQQAQKLFPGGLRLAGVDGDLTQGLVLHDVILRDLEGQPAIAADRVEIRYRLTSLLHTEVRVTKLAVTGLKIVTRPLLDGSNNLGTMVVTTPSKKPSKPFTSLPVTVVLDDATIGGRFQVLPPKPTDPALFDLAVDLQLSGGLTRDLVAEIAGLNVDVHDPATARLTAHGAVKLQSPISLADTSLRLETDAADLRARFHDEVDLKQVKVKGPIIVTAEGQGGLEELALKLHAHVAAPDSGLVVDSKATVLTDRADIKTLVVTAPFADVNGHGVVTFAGGFDGQVHAAVSDLSRLHTFGAPAMRGKVVVDVQGRIAGRTMHLVAKGHGEKLAGPGVTAASVTFEGRASRKGRLIEVKASGNGEKLTAPKVAASAFAFQVDSPDALELVGRAHASVQGFQSGKISLVSAVVDASGSKKLAKVVVAAQGPEKARLGFEVLGIPQRADGRLTGVVAAINSLDLSMHAQSWHQLHRAKLVVELDKPLIELGHFDLASGEQRLSASAKISGSDGDWSTAKIDSAALTSTNIDLSQLAPILSPGHVLPRTQISVKASAHGPLGSPDVNGHVDAEVFGRGDHDLIHLVVGADARLSNRRLVASVAATIGGQKANARVDLPIPFRPNAAISADVAASMLLNSWFAETLVPKLTQSQPLPLFVLDGKVTATVTLRGTTSKPELHAAARLATFHMAESYGDLGLSVEYAERFLKASFSTGLSSLPRGGGNGGGVIDATAELPIDLPALLSGEKVAIFPRNTVLHANAHIRNLGLEYLPLSAFQIDLPVHNGRIEANVDLSGTVDKPHLTADLAANKFDIGLLHAASATVRAELADRAVTTDISTQVDGSEALVLHASLHGNPAVAVYRRQAWAHARVDGKGQIAAFQLDRLHVLEGLGGVLHGDIEISGAVDEPRGTLALKTDNLNLGTIRFPTFTVKADLDGKGLVARVDAQERPGARLALDAKLPWQGSSGQARLVAQQFLVDLDSTMLSGVRTLRGQLDADVVGRNLGLGHLVPILTGSVRLSDGQLRIASTSMDYHGIAARLRLDGSVIHIEDGVVLAGEKGRVTLKGRVDLANGIPTKLASTITARKFPFQQQGLGVLIEADVDINGERRSDGSLNGTIRVAHGSARLPELLQTRVLLPIGPLEDVRIVDRIRHPAKSTVAGAGLQIGAKLDGPFAIRGKEINATLRGGIRVDLTGRDPALHGALRINDGGWIDLLGRRYDIERGVVAFDGTPNPRLSIRITRRTPAAQIGIDVSGPTNKPELAFWSDPPIYDSTQVAGLVLSGDPGTNGVSTEGLDRQAIGAISSLLVTSIKQKLLPELPIDVFRFGANNSTSNGIGAQIEIGKYIADKLYIGYAYQIGADTVGVRRTNQNEARLDYRLPKSLDLEATFGDAGVGGLDLFWTWRPQPKSK